jgi:hypothetical protein
MPAVVQHVITNVKHNENNEDFGGWEYGFKHYPTALEPSGGINGRPTKKVKPNW